MQGYFEKIDSKWWVPGVFLVLILVGFFLTIGKTTMDVPPETATVPPTPAVEERADPWMQAFSEPVVVDEAKLDPFSILLPMTESAPAEAEPVVARNGNSTPPVFEPVSEFASEPVAVPREKAEKRPELVSADFVPFVCFYQPTRGRNQSDWVYYFFPMSVESTEGPPMPKSKPMVCPQMPLFPVPQVVPVFCPVYYYYCPMPPACQGWMMPTPFPTVVPSRIGKTPKWVYPNGMVVKPKVYFRGRPVRNVLRAVTP